MIFQKLTLVLLSPTHLVLAHPNPRFCVKPGNIQTSYSCFSKEEEDCFLTGIIVSGCRRPDPPTVPLGVSSNVCPSLASLNHTLLPTTGYASTTSSLGPFETRVIEVTVDTFEGAVKPCVSHCVVWSEDSEKHHRILQPGTRLQGLPSACVVTTYLRQYETHARKEVNGTVGHLHRYERVMSRITHQKFTQ